MSAQSIYRRFGQFAVPLDPPTGDSPNDFARLDPARDILLDLFAAAINAELAELWKYAMAGTPLSEVSPVEHKIPGPASPELLGEMKTSFPALFVDRSTTGAQFGDLTIETRSLTQKWDVDYVLAPLTTTNLLRAKDVLQAVGKVIDLVIENGGHAAYRTVQSGNIALPASVLGSGPNCCGFWKCSVTDMALGPAAFSAKGDGPRYYACGLTLETVELSGFLTDAEGQPEDGIGVPLNGTTGTFGLTDSGDPSIIARG